MTYKPTIIVELLSPQEAEVLCRQITLSSPDYFGIPEINEAYFQGVHACYNFGARIEDISGPKDWLGLLCLRFPYPTNGNIYWMGVLSKFQRQGIGKSLIDAALKRVRESGGQSLTVETLAPSEEDENYLETFSFYKAMKFWPLFDLRPDDYEWNMVYMIRNAEDL